MGLRQLGEGEGKGEGGAGLLAPVEQPDEVLHRGGQVSPPPLWSSRTRHRCLC